MSLSLDTNTPFSYQDWLKYQNSLNPENHEIAYFSYLKDWYSNKNQNQKQKPIDLKSQYIQLAKDLSYLFAVEESSNPFLANIDYTSDEDLIYAIPFFAQKLRQIAGVLQKKREAVKQAKLKYNLIGSNDGFEKLLYEYVLKGFTNAGNSLTQVPISPLAIYFPSLASIKNNFFIEVEELHDSNTYFDSDPSVNISSYLSLTSLNDFFPLNGLNENEINDIISTRFLPRVANTTLSNVFSSYLLSIPTLSTISLSANAYSLIQNELVASQNYLGETVYGLTAVTLGEINKPDNIVNLNLVQGNNWFYWPSGSLLVDQNAFNNIYVPIPLTYSNFLTSGATAGSNYTNSDLLFTDKNGAVEGAWLQGPYTVRSNDLMSVTLYGSDSRSFIYPFPGIDVDSKTLTFSNYNINDSKNTQLDLLPYQTQTDILKSYYTSNLPNISADAIYLNQTQLISFGAKSAEFSTEADNVIKSKKPSQIYTTYSEAVNSAIDQAYLYKFAKTDIPIQAGMNYIHWPVYTYGNKDNSPISIKDDFCNEIQLSQINPSKTMVGAVAGTDFNNSDVIYKLNDKYGSPIEAAWLGSDLVSHLDLTVNQISVYNTPATKCSQPIDGPIQPSLSFKANASDKISFVWADEDTPADQVFKYVEHAPSCQYGKNMPHDFYFDQDYQNPNPINTTETFQTCTCKSIYYSPIGHAGDTVTDFNGMTDYLFADPDGLGVDFNIKGWTDTRGLDVLSSPQFSFYKITGGDSEVGYGEGYLETGNGTPMILKTGRRYTYYRTSLRSAFPSNIPYLVCNYSYKNLKGIVINDPTTYNLVIIIDASKSQTNVIDEVKYIARQVINQIHTSNSDTQISIIQFGTESSKLIYLTNSLIDLGLLIDQIQIYKTPDLYQTNIDSALVLADYLLSNVITEGSSTQIQIDNLCSNLNFSIIKKTQARVITQNDPKNYRNAILIFSDGVETLNQGFGVSQASYLKSKGTEIFAVSIGELSVGVDVMKRISSNFNHYYNLQYFLNSGDGDVNSFVDILARTLQAFYPSKPMWYRAIRDSSGNWTGTRQQSDMILRPGDYISYVHQQGYTYNDALNSNSSFTNNSISFTINIKLDGWDYDNNYYDSNNVGDQYGGKPWWAKVFTSPDENNNWYKGTMAFGGQVRFFNDYTPIHQPLISHLTLTNGSLITYQRNSQKAFIWQEPVSLTTLISTYQWNKLEFTEDFSNLQDFLYSNKLDGIVNDSMIPSDITLEGFSSFRPAYYNYYARNPFKYTEKLYNLNRCVNSFVIFNTGVAIQPSEPYSNILNVHYPTLATVSFPANTVSDRQVGEYLLPEKLGTSFYRGRGYTIELDSISLSHLKTISAERMFLDLGKFGPRNRGLTKKDQNTPTKISDLDNSWLMEPYSSGSKSGVITETLENQKLTPYQTSYEIYNKNHFGLARQNDIFEFWNPVVNGVWNSQTKYPLDFKKELPASQYTKRVKSLLCNKGDLDNWRVDLFGNDYGLYKGFKPNDIYGLNMWFSADYGTLSLTSNDVFTPDTPSDPDGNNTVIKWMDQSGLSNNLTVKVGSPKLIRDAKINNNLSIYFDGASNLYNDLNINSSNVTMFIVGSYKNNNTYAALNYQVLASFGSTNEYDKDYVNAGSLVFSQKYGDFNFEFGNFGGIPSDNGLLYEVHLTDYYFDISGHGYYPPDSKYYLFETVFNQPYAQVFINGNLFADNYGTLYSDDSGNIFNGVLKSIGGFYVGSYVNSNLLTPCYVAEIIFYNRTLTDNERKQVENYLINKYKIS